MKLRTPAICAGLFLICILYAFFRDSATPQDPRIESFISEKKRWAEAYGTNSTSPDMRPAVSFFRAATAGKWATATNRFAKIWKSQNGHYEDAIAIPPEVWGATLEVNGLCEVMAVSKFKFIRLFGDEVFAVVPRGAICFGSTTWGRAAVAGLSKSHSEGDPLFTISHYDLWDRRYLTHVRSMYGVKLSLPTSEQHDQVCRDAKSPAVAVLGGEVAKWVFGSNPARQFYVEEGDGGFGLDWMYPYLRPAGPILKLEHAPVNELLPNEVKADRLYWTGMCNRLVGPLALETNSVEKFCNDVMTIYSRSNRPAFAGDPDYLEDFGARQTFSKLRCAIASVYQWHAGKAVTADQREAMDKEAEFAFRQAWLLCPTCHDASFRYMTLLRVQNRWEDAIALMEAAQKLEPDNDQLSETVRRLRSISTNRATPILRK